MTGNVLYSGEQLYWYQLNINHAYLNNCCQFNKKTTWSHKNTYHCALSVRQPFYVPYCTFCRSFKEKCPLSGTKTQVKYMNPGTFLLCRYRYILLCFYYISTGTYSGGSKLKYLGSVPKNECSIMLEICPTPNPTLNLPDSVNKCKNRYKKLFVDATVPFPLPRMKIWTALLNCDYTRFEPELLASWIQLCTPRATE